LVAKRDGVRRCQIGVDQRLGQIGAVVGVGQGVDELADGRTDLAAEAERLGDFVRLGGAEPVPAAGGR
jgi:hypothetical protein